MEAQACGLPVLVSNEGGPKENVEHEVSGLVISSTDASAWCDAIIALLADEPRRSRMSLHAAHRGAEHSLGRTFESFWADHVAIVEPPNRDEQGISEPPRTPARV